MSQHQTWRGAVAMWVVGGREAAAPWRGPGESFARFAQKAVEGRFAGQIDAFVGQHRHDARRRQSAKRASLATCSTTPLRLGEGMRRPRAQGFGLRSPREALLTFPALQRTQRDAGHLAGRIKTRPGVLGHFDVPDFHPAIFQADHASSSLSFGKIASSFF
jgi:hypothetical protein